MNVLTIASRKRQFYRKIKEWGFEKNIKDKEMRTIVQGLNQRGNDEEDLNVELRGQRVDPVKIQRWQRRHRRSKDVTRPFSSNLSNRKYSQLSSNSVSRSNRVSSCFIKQEFERYLWTRVPNGSIGKFNS